MSRPLLTLVHRYLGLSLALFLIIAGLTGAVISWDRELDACLNPELFALQQPGQVQDSLALVQAFRAAAAGIGGELFSSGCNARPQLAGWCGAARC